MPNALPNRNNIEIEIYGMEGIPEEDVRAHEQNMKNKGGGKNDDDGMLLVSFNHFCDYWVYQCLNVLALCYLDYHMVRIQYNICCVCGKKKHECGCIGFMRCLTDQ